MVWNHVTTLSLPSGVFEMTTNRNSWLIRGRGYVAKVNPNQLELDWTHPIIGDYSFSYQRIVLYDQVVIFVGHRNSSPDEVWLQALKLKTGEALWGRPLNWTAFDNLGGLLVVEQGLIFIEQTNQAPRLLLISPLTGEVISQTKATIVEGAGTTREGEESAVYVANKAYFYQREEALYYFSPPAPEQGFKQLLKADVQGIAGQGINLYYHRHPFSLFWLDGETGQQKGKLTLPAYPRKLIAPAEALGNLLILFDNKEGLARVDFYRAKCCWHVGESEEWEVSYAVWTPAGIIARIDAQRGSYLVSLDHATGEQKPPPHPTGHLTGLFHWTGKDLLVGTRQRFEYKLEVFRPS